MRRLTYNSRVFTSFIVASGVLLVVAGMVYITFRQFIRENGWVDHTYEVIDIIQDVISDVKDVQSAQRGFAITGFEDYLAPYYLAVPRVEENLDKLCPMVADNPVQIKRCESLRAHAIERLNIAKAIIQAYKTEGQARAFEMIRNGSGKREMDEIRIIVADMIGEEKNLLIVRRTSLDRTAVNTIYAGAAGFLICLVILAIVFRIIRLETERRAATEESLGRTLADVERMNTDTQILSRLGDYLRSCRTEEEAYDIIGRNMPEVFPDTRGAVLMFNNSRNLLKTVLHWGDLPGWESEYEADTCWALRQGRVHVSGADAKAPSCQHLGKTGLDPEHPVICIPMQAHGDTIGEMIFSGTAATLSEARMDTFRAVAEQISLAMANLNMQRVLREQSIKDPLTKLYNRRYLDETLARELARAQRAEQPVSVILMDIDHFKKVNDTYGHEAGDAVLAAFASLLLGKVRKYDIPCRLGGEEFLLICPGATLETGVRKAEEICAATRTMQVKFQNQTLSVTVSIGVSVFPLHGEAQDDLIHNADMCLYKAKQGGRNQVVVYEPTAARTG